MVQVRGALALAGFLCVSLDSCAMQSCVLPACHPFCHNHPPSSFSTASFSPQGWFANFNRAFREAARLGKIEILKFFLSLPYVDVGWTV